MYQLFARIYGTNNLPDSSNMCHESSSVALPQSIGVVGRHRTLPDFEPATASSSSPRTSARPRRACCTSCRKRSKRGVKIITINPLRERGLERFKNPQSPGEMLTHDADADLVAVPAGAERRRHRRAVRHLQGADRARRRRGRRRRRWCGADGDAAKTRTTPPASRSPPRWRRPTASSVLDHDFIAEHTHGFEEFAGCGRGHDWAELERVCGLTRDADARGRRRPTSSRRRRSASTAWA